ncbi:MAG: hypothetical protein KME09_10060 [Pleurocapsa minor HA4230-MV1]|nr:hypothetical protein [Pleurocapsa minor HA4230-MV1]
MLTLQVTPQLAPNSLQVQTETRETYKLPNPLETFLLVMIGHLITIQISDSDTVYMWNINKIKVSLFEIQERNRFMNSYYIKADGWLKHFEHKLPRAILLALAREEICSQMSLKRLQSSIDFELLYQDTMELLSLTYNKNAYEIDRYLRDKWGERGFHFY